MFVVMEEDIIPTTRHTKSKHASDIFLLICEGERGDIKDSFCVVVITFDFDNTLLTLSVSL